MFCEGSASINLYTGKSDIVMVRIINGIKLGRVLLALVLVSLAFASAKGQGIDFDLDYSDPASDVMWIFENGSTEMKGEPKDVNIKWLRSELLPDSERLKLTIELSSPGQIRTDTATSYLFNIYTTTGNESHYVVNFTNGDCTLYTNTSANIINQSITHSVSGQELNCFVNQSELGNITYYNLDASAETYEYENATVGWVLKKDFGWELPGNPGTVPGDEPEEGSGIPGFGLWTLVAATTIALGIMTVFRKKYRE